MVLGVFKVVDNDSKDLFHFDNILEPIKNHIEIRSPFASPQIHLLFYLFGVVIPFDGNPGNIDTSKRLVKSVVLACFFQGFSRDGVAVFKAAEVNLSHCD